MDRNQPGLEDFQPVPLKQLRERAQRVVAKMFVVHLIEGRVFDHAAEIDRLHHEDAVLGQ